MPLKVPLLAVSALPGGVEGLTGWYDASDPSTVHTNPSLTQPITGDADAANIKGWRSKAGLTHVTNGSGTLSWKANIKNGRGVLRAGGAAQDNLSGTVLPIPVTSRSFTIFAVYYPTNITSDKMVFAERDPVDQDPLLGQFGIASTNSTLDFRADDGTGLQRASDGAVTVNTWTIQVGVATAGTQKVYHDGGAAGSGLAMTGPTNNITQVGLCATPGISGAGFIGDLAEVLVYGSKALSVPEINAVGNYLAAKWGVTWTTAS